jgi:hypothetical protein
MHRGLDSPSPRLRGEGWAEGRLTTAQQPQTAAETPPHPEAARRAASDLSPQTGRGNWPRPQYSHRLAARE